MQSLLSLLLLSLLSLTTSAQTTASGFCKAVPGSSEWPSHADWARLNATVGGILLAPEPPAALCHKGWPSYSPERCALFKVAWMDANIHAADPIVSTSLIRINAISRRTNTATQTEADSRQGSMWQNYNNYSCMPDSSAPCSGKGYPVYVVPVRGAEDIKSAVDFARTKKIRLNIKSTGHDFLGRY